MSALAADHRNDVVATIVALVFGIIGTIFNRRKKTFDFSLNSNFY